MKQNRENMGWHPGLCFEVILSVRSLLFDLMNNENICMAKDNWNSEGSGP